MEYGLPKSVFINDLEYAIRYDFRVVMDIFEALNEVDAEQAARIQTALQIFYPEFEDFCDRQTIEQAITEMFKFINGGSTEQKEKKQESLVCWEKDFNLICAAVNRVLGYETRAVTYDPENNTGGVHWYTWLSGYMEIGDCLFSQIVSIRSKKAKGKKLEKYEQEFYRENRELIDIPRKYSQRENEILKQWT